MPECEVQSGADDGLEAECMTREAIGTGHGNIRFVAEALLRRFYN
jgi:hypothetical protein